MWLRRALEVKRDGGALDDATWTRIIDGYVDGSVEEACVAALAMAVAIRGMDLAEIAALTEAMVRSGDVLAYPSLTERGVRVVDKHSSGGVGDTVSLVAVPLAAACGVPVAKLSGRALGHTGGTLDKLEAIPGVRTDLSPAAGGDVNGEAAQAHDRNQEREHRKAIQRRIDPRIVTVRVVEQCIHERTPDLRLRSESIPGVVDVLHCFEYVLLRDTNQRYAG